MQAIFTSVGAMTIIETPNAGLTGGRAFRARPC
jgi:hypothetical protein